MLSNFYPDALVEQALMPESDQPQTLVELLISRSRSHPDRTAYIFLADGETEDRSLTYGELDARARAIAARLQRLGASGERVLLLYPPELEYIAAFFGCLYAGAVAVPVYAPGANRTLARLQSVAADAQARVVLTTSSVFARVEPLLAQSVALQAVHWLTTDGTGDELAEEWTPPAIEADTLAFLQYTSGSTSQPKGVMVSHGNILHNERMIRRAFRQTEESVIVSWLPFYHDMGLIGGVLQPLYAGARCILMSPVSFLQKPLRWLQAVSRYRATTSGGPNFAYEMCAQKISPQAREGLDLSSWEVAFNGSEPVRSETLEQFVEAFGPCGFRREAFFPCYGLAEATLFVAGNPIVREPVVREFQAEALDNHQVVLRKADDASTGIRALVGCGTTFLEQKALIVNPQTCAVCAPGEVGEIWVAGASVAGGYWDRPEETEQVFNARLAGSGDGPFLRTGDLGFLSDDELFITGRLKDLIIIRGRNLYPQDIEHTVEECHVALRRGGGAAFSIESDGEERLVVVQELERRAAPDLDEVVERVRQAVVEEHEVQLYALLIVRAGRIPKTSSGKLQRRACREMFLSGGFEALAEWHEMAAQPGDVLPSMPAATPENVEAVSDLLAALIAARLGIAVADVDPERPITCFGLDSLQAIELMHAVEDGLGVVLPMVSFLQSPSITELARQAMRQLEAKSLAENEAQAAAAANTDTPESVTAHPPSHGQQALWLISRVALESSAYNVASAVRIRGDVDAAAMQRSFQTLVERHASLRTTFSAVEGMPVAFVQEQAEASFDFEDATSWGEALMQERLVKLAHRPFELEAGPLLRVSLFKRSEAEHVLLLVAHHIVVDFWSLAILVNELGALYAAERQGKTANLLPIPKSYSDYVRWQTRMLEGPEGVRQSAYWEKQLDGTLLVLNLYGDRPRPSVQTYRGASSTFAVNAETTRRIKTLGKEHDATLYMTLLAAFQALLYRYTGQEEILVGSPAAGRSRAAFSSTIGYFVNPLVMRADLSGGPSFETFLQRVRRTVLDAFAHQDYPFALLVKQLQPERDPGRSPLFQVTFVLQQAQLLKEQSLAAFALGEGGAQLKLGELVLEAMSLEQRVAQFDLSLVIAEVNGELLASLEYNTDLFDHAFAVRMGAHFRTLLEGIVAAPERRIASLPLLSSVERQQLLTEWNDTAVEYPPDENVARLFEQQAARTPERIAVTFEDDHLTYQQLNERANRLAQHLRARGVGPESIVGIFMERSIEMVIALLGVLKAGAAYLPLDPEYPPQRLAFMLSDSNAALLLTHRRLSDRLPAPSPPVLCLDSEWPGPGEMPGPATMPCAVQATNLAYVIYTSGSTGTPKGVMISHGALSNHMLWMQHHFPLHPDDALVQKTPFSFDASVWEFWAPLLQGARLVMAHAGSHRDAAYMIAEIERRQVTTLQVVPTQLRMLVAAGMQRCESLRRVFCGGEALSAELAAEFQEQVRAAELVNLYGPTEATIDATYWRSERGEGQAERTDGASVARTVPIGRPIANTRVYVLDEHLEPVPVGVAGELYLGGAGLGRGYVNAAAMTAERFIPDGMSGEAGARLYRTGDVGRYLPDGQIEYLGRSDQQVKVRGFRIELGEVEAELGRCAGVRESVVVVREDAQGSARLVAYVVPHEDAAPPAGELRRSLSRSLPEHMVPSLFVMLEALPLTPNGKVDRRALPEPAPLSSEPEMTYAAPRDQIEEMLADIWAAVLGVERVGIHDNFFELGGHSLLAAQVLSRVQKAFQATLPLRLLFESPTVAAFAERMNAMREDDGMVAPPPVRPASREGRLPLSFAQQRLWFLDQLDPGNHAYNMSGAVRLSGPLDVAALRQALSEFVRRHESLRTSFPVADGEPVQLIAPPAPLILPSIDLRELPLSQRDAELDELLTREARQPFDLARGPLLRLKLVRQDDEEHVLVVTMHHIISDGWSLDIFLRELGTLYGVYSAGAESPLPELKIQYADFASWQREWLQGERLEALLAYWKKQLDGTPPVLELPLDHPRPPVRTLRGARETLALPASLTDDLKAFSRDEGATLFMTLVAAFKTLLYRYSGQEEITIGTPSANRNQAEIEEIVGFVVNTLILRTSLSAAATFRDLLGSVRETVIDACTHQDLPFEKLVEELQPTREVGRTPLFQVMLAQQKALAPALEAMGVSFRPLEVETATAKFDLTLYVAEGAQELRLTLEYSTDLFEAATISRMLGHLRKLLEGVVSDAGRALSELPLLTEAEEQQLVVEFNDTGREYPPDESLHAMFEMQSRRTPEAVAVIRGRERLTYGELDARANQVAHLLREMGVGPETFVGIYTERAAEMLVGILGVLKAGGAYVPIDRTYPRERVKLMLADANVLVLLTEEALLESLPESDALTICLDRDWGMVSAQSRERLASGVLVDNLAYVIYTSGSTGRPKGVAITHRSAATMLRWAQETYSPEQLRGVLASTSISFDLSVFEMFLPLSVGGQVILADNALELPSLPASGEVTLVNTVPSAMAELLRVAGVPDSVKTINLAGEALKAELVRQVYERTQAAEVWNLYGPSEDTTYSTFALVPRETNSLVVIGRPVACTRAFVLDAHLRPVPTGVTGELYLGGSGLARGYLGRPELTAEKFIPDPFAKAAGARLYRTGDLVRYLPDGNLEYLGRIDHQVKIRGFRIELGEIETALGQHSSVRDVIVLAREDDPGDRRIVAYLIAQADTAPSVEDLRRLLREKLPGYMLPSAFVILDHFPLTPNGKVDRRALPPPAQTRPELDESFIAPRGPLEATIANIWVEILHLERVGVRDNFFSLGGHSLLATRVVNRVRDTFRVDVPLRVFFEAPTVADFAAVVAAATLAQQEPQHQTK
jgi:amino acid adenylation domain-containing protein